MSRRRSLEEHRRNLGDIREIMHSMKTLAYMETRKLARSLAAQQAVVDAQREAAAQLLASHPQLAPPAADGGRPTLYLVLGSERGLCGDFNQSLRRFVARVRAGGEGSRHRFLCIGGKLGGLLADTPQVVGVLEGAAILEEIPLRLPAMVAEAERLRREHGLEDLSAVACHGGEAAAYALLPTFQGLPASPSGRCPTAPLLYQSPEDFFSQLAELHLPVLLQWLLHAALMEENRRRVSHLDGAVRHLDEEASRLARRSNVLRQEEIIEEIEVILLSAASLAANRAVMGRAARDRGG